MIQQYYGQSWKFVTRSQSHKSILSFKKTKLVQNFSTLDGNQSFFYNIGSQGPKLENEW